MYVSRIIEARSCKLCCSWRRYKCYIFWTCALPLPC